MVGVTLCRTPTFLVAQVIAKCKFAPAGGYHLFGGASGLIVADATRLSGLHNYVARGAV